jgi:hypothetical protein
MDASAARCLVLAESCGEDGVIVLLRMGDDPGQERMRQLLLALRQIFDEVHGAKTFDRELAYALHVLAVYPEAQISSWSRQGCTWREELVAVEIPAVALAVESIFAGEWEELHA